MSLQITSPESVGFNAKRLERINPAMQHFVSKLKYAGISTLVARHGKVVHYNVIGEQDRETHTPMTPDTLYRIYSMTKPIICTALMMLQEEGKFRLFDPVAKYLPAFANVKVYDDGKLVDCVRPMTVRDLFCHMAGMTYDFLTDSPVGEMYRQAHLMSDGSRSLQATIAELARLPLAYQPGSRWHYSVSIDVLAHLIEVLSDMPVQEFLRTRFFEPLGMDNTYFMVPPKQRKHVASIYGMPDLVSQDATMPNQVRLFMQGHHQKVDVSASYPMDDPNFARGGFGLFCTTADYLRFAQMLCNGGELDGVRLLSRKTLELMHSNHVPMTLLPYQIVVGVPALGYGFGLGSRVMLDVAASAVQGSVGEFGWAGAAATHYWVDPREQIVGVMMSQYMSSFEAAEKTFMSLVYSALES
jgi:CubicO group peptidase (beta-lactamase class C family)